MLAKRVFDVVLAIVLLVLAAPLFLSITVWIWLTRSGPVFYQGLRTGRAGRPFLMLKFRTMVVDAEKKGGGTTALGDRRVLPFGRVLRHWKFDELPQLINVLRGDMSLVGPRPELPVYSDQYTPEEKLILSVPPGITDFSSIRFSALDQVVGERNADRVFEESVLPEKNRLRLKYVRTRSFGVDLLILVRTAWVLVRRVLGAERRQ